MSVKRKVTVPEGRSGMVPLRSLGSTWCCSIVACETTDLRHLAARSDIRVLGATPLSYALGKPSPRRFKESQRPWPMMR
jgi:hypothetical protein